MKTFLTPRSTRATRNRRLSRRRLEPHPELIEPRTLLSTFTVTNTGDVVRNPDGTIQTNADGTPVAFPGSLRAAIVGANGDTDPTGTTIVFNMDPSDKNHIYYKNDGIAGHVSRTASDGTSLIGITTSSDDSTISDIDPDWPHSWWSIKPVVQLPTVSHPVFIDGYSQPGSIMNTFQNGENAVLRIELDGSQAVKGNVFGLEIGTDGTTVRGIDVHDFNFGGIDLGSQNNGGNVIQGNFIGMDVSGSLPDIGDGISVGSNANTIGTNGDGTNDFGERNVVMSIGLSGSSNIVAGNFVGTDATGTKAFNTISTHGGVHVYSGSGHNRIGVNGADADAAAERNVISGNFGVGVGLEGNGCNVVAGNFIGTDVTGTKPLGNGDPNGGSIPGGIGITSDGNIIGTNGDGKGDDLERNIVSGNRAVGIGVNGINNIIDGNYVGVDVTGSKAVGNRLDGVALVASFGTRIGTDGGATHALTERNIIGGNGNFDVSLQEGGSNLVSGNLIGLGADGSLFATDLALYIADSNEQIGGPPVPPNTPSVVDTPLLGNTTVGSFDVAGNSTTGAALRYNSINLRGITFVGSPNHNQNAPVLTAVAAGTQTHVSGTLASVASTQFAIDFYATAFNSTGQSGLMRYLGSTYVTTDASGHASFDCVSLSGKSTVADQVEATATNLSTGDTSMFSGPVSPSNDAPVANAGGPYTIHEGDSLTLNAAASSDADGDPLTYSWDINGDGVFGDATGVNPTLTWSQLVSLGISDGPATYQPRVQVNDPRCGMATSPASTLQLLNAPPSVGPITAPVSPTLVNSTISASASFSDLDVLDTHTAVWDWGDGTTSAGIVAESNGSGTVGGMHVYGVDGVYTVNLTVTDDDGAVGQSVFQYVVIYNPNAGFVTGGGTITSPPGAYAANPSLTGKANFGFVSKYQKGATVPSGNTQFQFQLASLNFQSTNYQWLVVSGPQAQFKGTGTINGAGNDGFILTAVDGELPGGGGSDKFRIKIWDNTTSTVIYDNQTGASDTATPTTVIDTGDIVIHASTNTLQVAGGATVGGTNTAPLAPQVLALLVDEAIAQWHAAGVDGAELDALRRLQVRIDDLPGSLLGVADAGTIWVDTDAAGHGWFVGKTIAGRVNRSPQLPRQAKNRVDLLSVLEHEMGHMLGLQHTKRGVMAESLPIGMRHLALPASDASGRRTNWSLSQRLRTARRSG